MQFAVCGLLVIPRALSRLASSVGLCSGTTLLMVVLQPCELYVRSVDGRMHTITVPSSEPKVCFTTVWWGVPVHVADVMSDQMCVAVQSRDFVL